VGGGMFLIDLAYYIALDLIFFVCDKVLLEDGFSFFSAFLGPCGFLRIRY
jgi:hypothetical protein